MKTSSTFSILFWADFSRAKNDQASIYARITVNGKRATISLKRKVLMSDWDVHKNRARGTNQKSRILNSYLDETYNHLFKCYRDLMNEHKLITAQVVRLDTSVMTKIIVRLRILSITIMKIWPAS